MDIEQTIAILARTPSALRALLGGLDDRWTRANYGPTTFSPFDVVGHLIQGELTDWMPRVRLILERGPSQAFEPFDRDAMFERDRHRTINELLDEFDSLRRANLQSLRSLGLTAGDLDRRGTHPDFGAVTMGQLLATWVVHDWHHLAQVCKAMSFQLRDEVGP